MRLVRVSAAPAGSKHKWVATFADPPKKTPFGARGYDDYTLHGDPVRAERYRQRHHKDLATGDPTRAGFLSYYLLWRSPNMRENLRWYKSTFHL